MNKALCMWPSRLAYFSFLVSSQNVGWRGPWRSAAESGKPQPKRRPERPPQAGGLPHEKSAPDCVSRTHWASRPRSPRRPACVGQVQDARPLALSFRPVNECIGGPAGHRNLDFFVDHFLLARAGGTEVPRGLKSALHYLTMRGLTPCCSTARSSAGRSLC